MRRFFLIGLLFLSGYCFSQQNIPGKIIGQIPSISSTKLYQIQVGAFKNNQNAETVYALLKRGGLTPVFEKYFDFTRVMIIGVSADRVPDYLARIKQMGFNEVIIREQSTRNAISEKWEITTPESIFSSFEFNQDHNYIAVKNAAYEDSDKLVYFGEYTMPARDTISMDNLGVLKIRTDAGNNVSFSFSPIDEPGAEIGFVALKAERMPESPETDLFCRTWRVVNCTLTEQIGNLLFVSNAGTYFFTTPDGESNSLSQWRWYNNGTEEFDYSHTNWQYYGRAKILELTINRLKMFDPGFSSFISGYSSTDSNDYWELVPVSH
jgi:hypothetical protein